MHPWNSRPTGACWASTKTHMTAAKCTLIIEKAHSSNIVQPRCFCCKSWIAFMHTVTTDSTKLFYLHHRSGTGWGPQWPHPSERNSKKNPCGQCWIKKLSHSSFNIHWCRYLSLAIQCTRTRELGSIWEEQACNTMLFS